jgi:hypothetical protein
MKNNHYETNYSKQYKKKLTKKDRALHTISVELKKTPNILHNNYQNYNTNQIKIINLSNNNNNQIISGTNKIFKNIKLYGVTKNNTIKKRNIKTKKISIVPAVSFTETNGNIKKTFYNFSNIPNNTNFNNTMNLYRKSNHSNTNIKVNKSLHKSKSNKYFLTPFQYYNVNTHSRNKNINSALMKYNSGTSNAKSFNNSNTKKIISSKINKYTINFSPVNNTTTLSSKKNNKNSESRHRDGSGGRSVTDKMKIEKLIKEKENKDKEIKYKDSIIKEQENIISLLKQNEKNLKEQNQIINNKYEDLKKNYQDLINENLMLKEQSDNDNKNINFLKEKEVKLMRMLYLIKEKGIDINEILNEVKNESNNESINKSQESYGNNNSSTMTIYFPDKINMPNIMETKKAEIVPKIDFNQIPEYTFEDDKKESANEIHNQEEFNYNYNYNDIEFNNYGMNLFHRNSA